MSIQQFFLVSSTNASPKYHQPSGASLPHQRPPLMISPPATDLAKATREAFFHKAELARKGDGRLVPRLNICLDAMQLQFPECMLEHQSQSLTHQSAPGMRLERVITQNAALKIPAHDVVDVDDTGDCVRLLVHNEKAPIQIRGNAFEIFAECLRRGRRRNPAPVQSPAPPRRRQKLRHVPRDGRTERHWRTRRRATHFTGGRTHAFVSLRL